MYKTQGNSKYHLAISFVNIISSKESQSFLILTLLRPEISSFIYWTLKQLIATGVEGSSIPKRYAYREAHDEPNVMKFDTHKI